MDNVFGKRLRRGVKYEKIYPKVYSSPREVATQLEQYIQFYDTERRHQALGQQTPAAAYFEGTTKAVAA